MKRQEVVICPEAKRYEVYDWCKLSDNICVRNTGNSKFDAVCEWYEGFVLESDIEL